MYSIRGEGVSLNPLFLSQMEPTPKKRALCVCVHFYYRMDDGGWMDLGRGGGLMARCVRWCRVLWVGWGRREETAAGEVPKERKKRGGEDDDKSKHINFGQSHHRHRHHPPSHHPFSFAA